MSQDVYTTPSPPPVGTSINHSVFGNGKIERLIPGAMEAVVIRFDLHGPKEFSWDFAKRHMKPA